MGIGVLLILLGLWSFACGDSNTGADGDETGGPCTIDEECPVGQICSGGYCTSVGDGDVDMTCNTHIDCPAGYLCLPTAGSASNTCQFMGGDVDNAADGDGGDKDAPWVPPDCPTMIIDPSELNFGAVQVGNSMTKSFNIKNDSNLAIELRIDAIQYEDISGFSEFEVNLDPELEFPVYLVRNTGLPIEVTYRPANNGIDETNLTIVSNACDNIIYQLPMKSLYKGDRFVGYSPDGIDFGDVELGAEPRYERVDVCNTGQDDGNKILSINEITLAGGFSRHFALEYLEGGDLNITAYDPIMLNPGGDPDDPVNSKCFSFNVRYMPQLPAHEFDPHMDWIVISSDSDDISQRITEIRVQGTASSSLLSVSPYPVNFRETYINTPENTETRCDVDADCPTNQECLANNRCYKVMEVEVYNWTGMEQSVTFLGLEKREDVGDNNCDEFKFVDGNNDPQPLGSWYIPFAVQPGQSTPGSFRMAYRPLNNDHDQCSLQLGSSLPGMQWQYFTVMGKGRPPNKQPVARMALQSHATPIMMDIEGIAQNTRLCFYGNVSYDEDGTLEAFSWSMPGMPEGSEASFLYLDQDHINTCVKFDKGGEYQIQLKVQDDEGWWSDPRIVNVLVNANQGIWLKLKFQGGDDGIFCEDLTDVDLELTSPSGFKCSDENVNQFHTCYFPGSTPGESDGSALMTRWSNAAGYNGTAEEMRVSNPANGRWIIGAWYQNDCDCWVDDLFQSFCFGDHGSNHITIEIWDPNDYTLNLPLFPTLSTTLNERPDSYEWSILRVNGIWREPVPL